MSPQFKLIIYKLILLFISKNCLSEEILGCGGFIKSHTNIDYSKVQVKLFTKSGSLKDYTEAAPNSGYYFLPLYDNDKGEYILKVEPPRGWSFEPTEVNLVVDGVNDLCSQGKDINFKFNGFGITGKVISHGSNDGPSGVTVSLYKSNNRDVVERVTTTSQAGIFSFTPIQPGKYILVASHSHWTFEKNTVEVTVREGNTELPDNSLIIFGYEVSGRITSEPENEPVVDVSILLFGNGKIKNCKTPVISKDSNDNNKALCQVKSDKNGKFIFSSVSNGDYRFVPYFDDFQTKFDVEPTKIEFKINHNDLIVSQTFKVTGFTVTGHVMMAKKIPLPNAKVFLSGKEVAKTNSNGGYTIDKMKPGQYTLKVEASDVQFDEQTIKISPSDHNLPDILPSSYKVCGSVTLSTKGTLHHRKIIIENAGKTFKREIETDPQTGQYCLYLAPDKYQMSVAVTAEEKAKGLQFFPVQQNIEVSSKPINSINFLQLKATLVGSVECLKNSDCNKASITLKVLDGVTVQTIPIKNGRYEFTEILPGHYEVLIDTDVFCWENPSHRISVTSERAEIPVFKQTGFSVTFISSHDSAVEFIDPVKGKKVALTLPLGSTRHCVSSPGEYKFIPKSCHIYAKDSYTWDTKTQAPIILSSTEHRHRGKILSKAGVDNVKVKIESGGELTTIGPLKYTKTGDSYRYNFDFNANTDTTYVITPISDILLFNPSSLKVIGSNDCNNEVATLIGDLGKIVSGKVSPALEGVTIQIYGKDKSSPVHTLVTQKDGAYRIGPLDGTIEYTVTAEKVGYAISGPDANGVFAAHKLAEIIVEVTDQADDAPLQGVLLSLSGGQSYRKNSITSEQGQLSFNSLSPGEYYLRPMMKEYRFDPPFKMISVAEGATLRIKLSGNRVAFSAYGVITSLNGEAESGLIVEAQGQGECSNLQEEATTEETGSFRIRGLQPTCMYIIRLKSNIEANAHIQRVSPSSIAVQATEDITKLRFIAFHPISRTDVSVRVFSDPEHYRTLKVKLCREDQPDSPIHTAKIDPQQSSKFTTHSNPGFLIHLPSLQSNGRKYFVQLDTSLSSAMYKYNIIPNYFEANTSFKAITLNFNAERKVDQSEMNQSSLLALPFIMMIALGFLNRDKLWSWLNSTVEQWSKPTPVSRVSQPVAPIDPRADDIIVEQIMNINKRKTKPRKT
ncbi:nodal modulator 3 [Microplitis demolitor]|uniref:nodal modulator 3 n=1 Tax=Microplitis demolitor TaxID=69319 RepID=UPI0004CDB9BD|nr:nodal modulator 3 [Microplitis demolitor]